MSYYLLPHISSTLNIENIDISHNEIINSKKKSNQLVKNSQVYLSNLKKRLKNIQTLGIYIKNILIHMNIFIHKYRSKKLRYPSVNLSLGHILNLLNLQMFLIY